MRFEHVVLRTKVGWDGGDYRLLVMVEKDDWKEIDNVEGEWKFVEFVPPPYPEISGSFEDFELEFIRLAVFRRQQKSTKSKKLHSF